MKKIELVLNPFDLKLVLDFDVNICSIFFVLFVHLFSCIYFIENYVGTWCVLEGGGGNGGNCD